MPRNVIACIIEHITSFYSQLTWSGLGHLSSLTNLRHLNCSGIKYVEDGASGDKATAVPLHRLLGQLSRLTMGDACTLSWVDDRLMAVVGAHASRLTTLDCSGCIDMSDAGERRGGHLRLFSVHMQCIFNSFWPPSNN